jgi:hypothetical protein
MHETLVIALGGVIVGQIVNLRAAQRAPRLPALRAGCQPAAGYQPAPHEKAPHA